MVIMLLGLILFLGIHMVPTRPELRGQLIARLGEGPYKVLFALTALAGLLLTGYGYGAWRAEGPALVWDPPLFLRHVTMGLMLLASIAAVAAYVPSHIKAWIKHPLVTAAKIWAFAHLLVNGDIASIVLFASVLAWAVYDRISVKRRGVPLPVAPSGWVGDGISAAGGVALYLGLTYLFHPFVIGVPVTG